MMTTHKTTGALPATVAPAAGTTANDPGKPTQREPARLAPPWRKLLLTAHLIVAVGLLGADAVVIALGIAGLGDADPATVYPAASLVATYVIVPLAVLALTTGLAMGLLTGWGLVRHRWVTIKLGLTAVLAGLAAFLLAPRFAAAADAATATSDAQVLFADRLRLVLIPAAALTVLALEVALAVYKPFMRHVRPHSH